MFFEEGKQTFSSSRPTDHQLTHTVLNKFLVSKQAIKHTHSVDEFVRSWIWQCSWSLWLSAMLYIKRRDIVIRRVCKSLTVSFEVPAQEEVCEMFGIMRPAVHVAHSSLEFKMLVHTHPIAKLTALSFYTVNISRSLRVSWTYLEMSNCETN